eukprot:CAMPEP_0197527778 /NCGR_PEP_ID=MMETSP1318-20131121/22735_1 /TAXON_ID=552666 /ORGANISM="Partenskyella glossopodia, Strain RCC365" /LENGTH=548 /DNA_ID=CAMNT_0043082579 /DNA_START=24 /DNA_END=1670 /DNA_ORIENTATION=+
MPTSAKRQEKLVQEIRAVRKLKPNKRCFDCTEKGPTYVCTNFNTFVCTTCAGIHREFSHTVKSISMAIFSPEEVEALKNGGNAVAKKKWRGRWKDKSFPVPDSNEVARIREFMKLTYEDKKWAKKAPRKKKKKKKRADSSDDDDSDEDEDSDDSESEEEEQKRSRRKKKKKKTTPRSGERRTRKAAPKASAKPTKAQIPANGIAVTNLFGDMSISDNGVEAKRAATATSQPPPATNAAKPQTEDDWANFGENGAAGGGEDDWADFGRASASATATATATAAAAASQQPAAAPPASSGGGGGLLGAVFDTNAATASNMPSFNIMEAGPPTPNENGQDANGEKKEKPRLNSPVGLHQAFDDPFSDLLGGGGGNTPIEVRESSIDAGATLGQQQRRNQAPVGQSQRAPNGRNHVDQTSIQPRVQQGQATGNPFVPGGGQAAAMPASTGVPMQGVYPGWGAAPQMSQQQMLLMQQQQYMMMLQQRQAMMMRMQQQYQQQQQQQAGGTGAMWGQNQGGAGGAASATPPTNQTSNQGASGGTGGQIDIGNPFLQ